MFSNDSANSVKKNLQDPQLRKLIRLVRDIPFAFTPDLSIRSMLRIYAGGCSPKHALLHDVLTYFEVQSRLVYVSLEYSYKVCPYPKDLNLAEPGKLFGHTTVQIQTDTGWQFLDISFDRFLGDIFNVNHELSSSDESLGEVLDLCVVEGQPTFNDRRESLGLQRLNGPKFIADMRQRMKRLNKWMIDLRRDHFPQIREEQEQIQEAFSGILAPKTLAAST